MLKKRVRKLTHGLSFRAAALSMASGMLASLCLPPFGIVPLIAFLSVPALKMASSPTMSVAVLHGGLAGFGWFLASCWWISLSFVMGDTGHWPLLPLALIGLPALLALFWMPAAALAYRIGRNAPSRLVWFVFFLGLAEWARGYVATGFPWNAPGYLFSAHISLLQGAGLVGLYGLTFLALLVAIAPALWRAGMGRLALAAIIILPLIAGYGMIRLHRTMPTDVAETDMVHAPHQVRLVQPAVPQHEKWRRDLRPDHLDRLRRLSRDQVPVPQLIIWPETAFAGLLDREAVLFKETVWSALPFDGWMITGVPRFDETGRLFNSAALVRPSGEVEALYSKRRLVPFGEFVPFRSWLPFADALAGPVDFSPADENVVFDLPGYGLIQVQICYETIFPKMISQGPRPDILVNLTNDAWFGNTPGPWQHLAKARMRGVEEGITVIRVANTGVSAAFDGVGRTLAQIDLNESDFVDVDLPEPMPPTLFARWRSGPVFLLILVLGVIAIRLDRKGAIGQ